MKLMVDTLEGLDLVPVRKRAVDGFKAMQFQYDFVVQTTADGKLEGKAGQYLVVDDAGAAAVYSAEDFAQQFQRIVPRDADAKAKHGERAAAKAAKPKAAAKS